SLNRQQSIPIVESLLLSPDLDVNISDSNGRTALWHAVNQCHYDLVNLLLRQSHLRLNGPDRYGVLKLLLKQSQIRVNSWSRDVVLPLWSACRTGNFHVVEALLRLRSIQINQTSPTGVTPLQVAVILNHVSIVSLLLRQVNLVDINAPGPQQRTAIFSFWVTQALLKYPDIDLGLADNQGRKPLWWAENGGHSGIVHLLRRHSQHKRQKRCLERDLSD
ncbi:hypothetical protein N7451_012703, partial [Penicillium sp. IBT 35674x]